MGKQLSKEDINYRNFNFWWYYILSIRGFDDKKELNLDDAIKEVVNEDKYVPNFLSWYNVFSPDSEADADGYFEKPNTISGNLKNNLNFAIEFHSWHTTYYLNDRYIGNLGGHFEAWFFTLEELLAFDEYDFLFLLMLPMVGVESQKRQELEKLVSEKLGMIEIFSGQENYIAKCIVNGLVMDKPFSETEHVGTTCMQNHSVRNITKYPRYIEDVVVLNRALAEFIAKQ